MKRRIKRAGEDEEEEENDKERKRSGQDRGNDLYLRPIQWIMDDGCLRFLEEKRGEEHGVHEREGRRERKKKR